jgi:hypothetical protein
MQDSFSTFKSQLISQNLSVKEKPRNKASEVGNVIKVIDGFVKQARPHREIVLPKIKHRNLQSVAKTDAPDFKFKVKQALDLQILN